MENLTNFLYNKNPLFVLSYLSKNIYESNTVSSISKELKLSVGSVHAILKNFEQLGLVTSKILGKNVIYELDKSNPILKPFRTFDNITDILPIIEQIKLLSRKIILFGSCSRGEDTINSDIDLFILSDGEQEKISEIINEAKIERQINPIIVNTVAFMELERDDTVFFNEIMKGIVLWEV